MTCCLFAYVASDWTPKKLNIEVQMPDTLDLGSLRAGGQQPGEQLQPEDPTGEILGTASMQRNSG